MNLAKTTFFSGIGTAIRMVCGFAVNKIVAVVAGPPGVALMGQFQNFVAIITSVGSGNINVGVVKYIAENRADSSAVRDYMRAAGMITVGCVVTTMLVALGLSGFITHIIFGERDWIWLIWLTILTLPLFGANAIGLAILNGVGEIREYIVVGIFQALFGAALLVPLAYWFGIKGALAALVLSQTVVFAFLAWRLRRRHLAKLSNFIGRFPMKLLKDYAKFSIMAATSVLAGSVAQIYIRGIITRGLSPTDAGIWQGMVRLSNAYLTLITTALQVYYLPKLASLHYAPEIRAEVFNAFKLVIPVLLLSSALIYIFRERIILLLFTPAFLPMRELFFWQLIGDIVKIASWLFSILLWAKGMIKTFIISEIIGWLVYAGLSKASLVLNLGLVGPILANLANYGLYVVFAYLAFRYILKTTKAEGASSA